MLDLYGMDHPMISITEYMVLLKIKLEIEKIIFIKKIKYICLENKIDLFGKYSIECH